LTYPNYIYKKSIFAFPLLAILLLVSSGFAKINVDQNSFFNEVVFHKQVHHHNDLNICNVTSLDEVEIVFSEIESELEFELKWGAFLTIYSDFLELASKKENCFSFIHQFKNNQKVPLYDLFCNWRHHLG
jgi:hypothetical protein